MAAFAPANWVIPILELGRASESANNVISFHVLFADHVNPL